MLAQVGGEIMLRGQPYTCGERGCLTSSIMVVAPEIFETPLFTQQSGAMNWRLREQVQY